MTRVNCGYLTSFDYVLKSYILFAFIALIAVMMSRMMTGYKPPQLGVSGGGVNNDVARKRHHWHDPLIFFGTILLEIIHENIHVSSRVYKYEIFVTVGRSYYRIVYCFKRIGEVPVSYRYTLVDIIQKIYGCGFICI